MTSIRETLPEAHRRLLPVVFDRPEIPERRATCEACAMCSPAEAAGTSGASTISFAPDLKCCTYQPTLPNFLVGAVLSDSSPEAAEGRRRMQARIRSRIGVTPQWLAPSRKHRVLLDAARATSFGRSKVLLCPFFVEEGGLCSIWRHREAVCSTFFCKHEAGAAGHAFWIAEKAVLAHHEMVLARHAAQAVFPGAAEPTIPRLRLTLEDLEDRPPSEDDYVSYWGEWEGREEELYRRAYEVVQGLSATKALDLLADEPRAAEHLETMAARYDAVVSPRLAERLVMNPALQATPVSAAGDMAVLTYSAYDPVRLVPELWAVLPEFTAEETVAEVKARLDRDKDVTIGDDLLLVLQNHAILVPPPASR